MAVAVPWCFDCEDLVDVDVVGLEHECAAGHVELPDLRPTFTDFGNCGFPILFEIEHPPPECQRIVLPQVFQVPDLQSGVLKSGDDASDLV